jgi:hypothetical protein
MKILTLVCARCTAGWTVETPVTGPLVCPKGHPAELRGIYTVINLRSAA